ncbi:unnamed protein product, partial [marine sediment metagenome]
MKKKPLKKKPARKKFPEKKPLYAKCPECGYENPINQIYCGQCANLIILKRQDQEPPSEPDEELEEEPADLTKTIESPTEELTTGTTFAGRY